MIHKDDQETWDGLVAQCSDGSFSSINVASWKRSRAIMNFDAEIKRLSRALYEAIDEARALRVELGYCKEKLEETEAQR